MKTPNDNFIAPDTLGPEDDDQELRALISVDLDEDDDMPRCQAVDEFSDEFLLQAPRCQCGKLQDGIRSAGPDPDAAGAGR